MSKPFIEALKLNPHAISESDAEALYSSMPSSYRKWVKKEVFVSFFGSYERGTILWHDYEAGGTDAKSVAPLQFAGLRTTHELDFIDEPCDWYCRLSGDRLPHPDAIAITKIHPQKDCQEKGLHEPVFFREIHSEFSVPGSCITGYNSLGYDEEVTRFGFWRNLLRPYAYAFEKGNSRWDLLNVVTAYRAFSPESINWPKHEDGRTSLKLEDLAQENDVTQENAHNAMDDVVALIGVARKLKLANPELWKMLWSIRKKNDVKHQFYPGSIGIMASSRFGSQDDYVGPVLVLGNAPGDFNKYTCVNLNYLDVLRSAYHKTDEELRLQLFSKKEELEASKMERLPVFTTAINKCPVFLREDQAYGHQVPEELILAAGKLMKAKRFIDRLNNLFVFDGGDVIEDPSIALYASGFPSDSDESTIIRLSQSSVFDAFSNCPEFENPIYETLWSRARGKLDGFEGIELTEEQKTDFKRYCIKHRNARLSSEKHKEVSDKELPHTLSESPMDDSLKQDYQKWYESISI